MTNWYVIQTMTGYEQECIDLCQVFLDKQLYEKFFFPKYIRLRRFGGTWHEEKKNLLPGYFFLITENIDDVRRVLYEVPKFTRFLRDADQVQPIQPEEQEYLENMMDENYIVQMSRGFQIGEKICICDGPLASQLGKIRYINRHKRIAEISVNLFGRETPVEVGLEILRRLSKEDFRKEREEIERQELAEPERQEISQSATEKTEAAINIQTGDPVLVISGAFEGIQGTVVRIENDGRLQVELPVFGVMSQAVFEVEEVRRI